MKEKTQPPHIFILPSLNYQPECYIAVTENDEIAKKIHELHKDTTKNKQLIIQYWVCFMVYEEDKTDEGIYRPNEMKQLREMFGDDFMTAHAGFWKIEEVDRFPNEEIDFVYSSFCF